MKVSIVPASLLAYAITSIVAVPSLPINLLKRDELSNLQSTANDAILSFWGNSTVNDTALEHGTACTLANLAIRREYGSLSQAERKSYSDAVLCLQAKGAFTPADLVPGAKSRYDDFVAAHINQALTIHYTGTFLAWHRYFIWVYEQALREECGYRGYQPYWDWPKYSAAPQDSPIFNGDAYSLSGNGKFIPGHNGTTIQTTNLEGNDVAPIYLEPGLGGGCVMSGPFANMSVNLGPISISGLAVGPDGGLGYNPRCLKRDIGPSVATKYSNLTEVITLILDNDDIWDFETNMQGYPGSGSIGVHGGGHYTISGDPGGDFFVSPGDPAFYTHHAQIDRIWTIWQALDLEKRTNAISGTGTFLNRPPSANTTLDTIIELGYVGAPVQTMRNLMSTVAGPFCYLYI